MSPDPVHKPSHPDELLPWYVNHTLSPQEHEAVEGHIQQCPRCQKEIVFLENMRGQVQATSFESPGELELERLLTKVRKDKDTKQPLELPPSPTWWKTVAIAASLILVVQTGLLIDAWFFSKPMVPLSGPQQEGMILQISFVPTATAEDIRTSLLAIDGSVIEGPSQLGIYRIRLNHQSENTIEMAVGLLRQQTTVVQHVARE